MGGEKLKLSRPCRGVFLELLFLITLFFVFTLAVSAQTVEPLAIDESAIILGEAPAAEAPSAGSSIFVVLRMVLVLALAALAIYGVVFFVKRLARPQESRDPHLKVLARVSLSSDTYAAVISVGAKAWLVGGGGGALNLISEIDDAEALETMLLEDARKQAENSSRRFIDFRSLLSRLGKPSQDGRAGTSDSLRSGGGSLADSLRKQRERLKKL